MSPLSSKAVKQHSRSRSEADMPSFSRSQVKLNVEARSSLRKSRDVRSPTPNLNFPISTVNSSSLPHASLSVFSPPKPGQTLLSYLRSQDTETCADLERENAHFFISEAVIAAVEQMFYDRNHHRNLVSSSSEYGLAFGRGSGGSMSSDKSRSDESSVGEIPLSFKAGSLDDENNGIDGNDGVESTTLSPESQSKKRKHSR